MSLDSLPEAAFCETDSATVERAVITTYEGIAGTTLYPGDPVRLFLEALAAIIIQQRHLIDYTGKQNLLKYAVGNHLDHLGTFTETGRLDAAAARATARFNIDEPLAFDVALPDGTRISPDGRLFFATLTPAVIPAGQTFADVTVQCLTPGSAGNGFVAGQVNKMVDPVNYVSSAATITPTSGGADQEADDPYRERIHTAPESFSVAGPSGAYQHWAKSAHQDIHDVSVYRTCPLDDLTESQLDTVLDTAGIDHAGMSRNEKQIGIAVWLESAVVNIRPLLKHGIVPDQEMLDRVQAMVSDRTRRPLTDRVVVAAPSQVHYTVNFTYYISEANRLAVAEIQNKVAAAAGAYTAWQKEKLGRDINPAQLIHLVVGAGAHRVEVATPVYTPVSVDQVAAEDTVDMGFGGFESD